jgi:hypothetical protein
MNARQRTQIRALADGTRTYQDIADALDIPRASLIAAMHRHGIKALRSRPTPGRRLVPARRDIVRALADGTRTSAELAAAAGVTASYARHMAPGRTRRPSRAGIALAKRPWTPARLGLALALDAAGYSMDAIARAVRADARTAARELYRAWSALGHEIG